MGAHSTVEEGARARGPRAAERVLRRDARLSQNPKSNLDAKVKFLWEQPAQPPGHMCFVLADGRVEGIEGHSGVGVDRVSTGWLRRTGAKPTSVAATFPFQLAERRGRELK